MERGTKQGDPLSPPLFIMALEPLAIAIREKREIKGIKMSGLENKILIFADDVLVLLSEPKKSIPPLLDLVNSFSEISGYRVNWDKSEVMPLSDLCTEKDFHTWKFRWTSGKFKYLGIYLSAGLRNIVPNNFDPVLNNIQHLIKGWDKLQLSLWGRVQAIKMVIVPKLNYLFNMLPLNIPKTIFKALDKTIKQFIWAGKKPGMNLKKMQKKKEYGGLGVPNFKTYKESFTCAQIISILDEKTERPLWVLLEAESCAPFDPIDCLSQSPTLYMKNPIISHTIDTWQQLHKRKGLSPFLTKIASLWYNPSLKIGGKTFYWKDWHSQGIKHIEDLYTKNSIKSFDHIKQEFGLNNKDFWKYLQLRTCLQKMSSLDSKMLIESSVHSKLKKMKFVPHLVGHLYSFLTEEDNEVNMGLKKAWEKDLETTFERNEWEAMVKNMLTAMRDARSKLIQFKIFNRLYWTPVKMHRARLSQSNLCWRCNLECGNLVHMLFSCPNIQVFWWMVTERIGQILGKNIKPTPTLCILNKLDTTIKITSQKLRWLKVALTTAKRVILRHWKSQEIPSYEEWFLTLAETASFERLIYKINEKLQLFNETWDSFLKQI